MSSTNTYIAASRPHTQRKMSWSGTSPITVAAWMIQRIMLWGATSRTSTCTRKTRRKTKRWLVRGERTAQPPQQPPPQPLVTPCVPPPVLPAAPPPAAHVCVHKPFCEYSHCICRRFNTFVFEYSYAIGTWWVGLRGPTVVAQHCTGAANLDSGAQHRIKASQ